MRGLAATAAIVMLAAGSLSAQDSLVGGISADRIALTADFTGSDIFAFGAIKRDPTATTTAPLDIVVTLKGPTDAISVRRKSRLFGLWLNTDVAVFSGAPEYYAIATTRPVENILSASERRRFGIGLDTAALRISRLPETGAISDFADALIRIKTDAGLYRVLDRAVLVSEDTLFQTRFSLPAHISDGSYALEMFLIRSQEVISSGTTTIRVQKAGIERWLYNLSQHQPLRYGLLAVALALIAGWLAAAAFGLRRR